MTQIQTLDQNPYQSGDIVPGGWARYREQSDDVFLINDIDLRVPPTDITIQKEDLIHQWRSLRSNSSTKIPSGQGQIAVSVVIAFTGDQVLDMHRLIVELRHSPFCSIENRFIRESIVPHWPGTQIMAFTMTGLSIAPMEGSSDSWIMQLDLTWFNYAPYVHNFLYRKDWHTVPVRTEGAYEDVLPIEVTIGWDWDGDLKKTRHVVLPGLSGLGEDDIRTWDVTQQRYVNRSHLTIEEMQTLHRGEIFDLQPLPNLMAPSEFVGRADHSLIYSRYINYLQRDALQRNFDINAERDLGYRNGQSTPLHASMFNAILDGKVRRTYGLHRGPPRNSGLYKEWRIAASKWVSKINSFHGGAVFSFAAYNEMRLPSQYAEAIQKAHQDSIENARDELGLNDTGEIGPWMDWWYYEDMKNLTGERIVFGRSIVRRGWTNPQGKVVPIGKPGSDEPMTVGECLDDYIPDLNPNSTGYINYRGPDVAARLYGSPENHKPHVGTDFRTPIGAPVFSTAAGTVTGVNNFSSSRGGTWARMSPNGNEYIRTSVQNTKPDEEPNDFEQSLSVFGNIQFDGAGNISSSDGRRFAFPVGTAVPSVNETGVFYVVMPRGGGRNVRISHGNGEFSLYVHLDQVKVDVGDDVEAGTFIGTSGASGPFKQDFLNKALKNFNGGDTFDNIIPITETYKPGDAADGEETTIWLRSPHLHYEYWEPLDMPGNRDPAPIDDGVPIKRGPRYYDGMAPVDPIPSLQIAGRNSHILRVDPALLAPDSDDAARVLEEELGKDVKNDLMATLQSLWDDDWMYYDRDAGITNIWWKIHRLAVGRANPEVMRPDNPGHEVVFRNTPVVLTGVAGGLRHVVANIPILGHEFPTQQHLGSIEPFYSFEFCAVDKEGRGAQHLAGLPREAQLLIGMRSLLHANARNFRPIVDSWAVSCDSFITRMLGSFRVDDNLIQENTESPAPDAQYGQKTIVDDVELKRRLINTRGTSMTVKGHPGLTCHTLEFQETNPYEQDVLTGTAPAAIDVEKHREMVLDHLINWKFADQYRDVLLEVLIAQLAGGNTEDVDADDFGDFELQYIATGSFEDLGTTPAIFRDGDTEWLVLGEHDPGLVTLIESLGQDVHPLGNGAYAAIPASMLGMPTAYTTTTTSGTNVLGGIKQGVITGNRTAGVTGAFLGGLVGGLIGMKKVEENVVNLRYSVSDILEATQATLVAADIPLGKILDLWALVAEVKLSAEMMLAEDHQQIDGTGRVEFGGQDIHTVKETLYGVEVIPSLFKYFQVWLEVAGEANRASGALGWSTPDAGTARWRLQNNRNWVHWETPLELQQRALIDPSTAQQVIGIADSVVGGLLRTSDVAIETLLMATGFGEHSGIRVAMGEDPAQIDGHFASFVTSDYDRAHSQVAKNYLWFLPLKGLAAQERFKSYITDLMIGDLESLIQPVSLSTDTEQVGSPVFSNLVDQLKIVAASSGYWMPSTTPRAKPWFIVHDTGLDRTSQDNYLENGDLTPEYDQDGSLVVPVTRPESGTFSSMFLNNATGIYTYDSPFIWYCNEAVEQSKLQYFKGLFARFADEMLNDIPLLRAFGLEGLAALNQRARLQGAPAYPDLDLPFHPYYGDITNCPPDFYMWNIYEDGQAHHTDTLDTMYQAMESIVENCYRSIKNIEGGGEYKPDQDKLVLDPGVGGKDKVVVPQGYNAEGTDGGGRFDRGHTNFPYADHPDSHEHVDKFFTGIKKQRKVIVQDAQLKAVDGVDIDGDGILDDLDEVSGDPAIDEDVVDQLGEKVVRDVRVSLTENFNGVGGGVQYPRRMPVEKYEQLSNELKSVQQMFGSRAGYLNRKDIPDDVNERAKGTSVERDVYPSHLFGADSIKQLARMSARDIVSQKRTMRRAYPTFKLFFVEEDEMESRLLNFDDFYSYNAVTSFSVVQSRKSPADHAVITLLNVAGTLDGTKRDAVVDLDYFSPEYSRATIPGEKSNSGGDPVATGTALDQPFGAVVLRPGLNVQLRVGYSNDPDQLEVLISGRIADVQWNSSGDRAEILVQSFGTELIQAIKGTAYNKEPVEYATTHQLLGAMMLEPELMHFGRWEFGKLYQVGEGSDHRLDFNDYSREGFLGRFKTSNQIVKWMLDHPVITTALVVAGGAVLSRAPGAGRMFRGISNVGGRFAWSTKVLGRLGLTGSGLGYRGWVKALTKAGRLRAGGQWSAGTGRVALTDVSKVLRTQVGRRDVTFAYLNRLGGEALVAEARALAGAARQAIQASDRTAGEIAKIMAKFERDIFALGLRGQWMTNPTAFSFSTEFFLSIGMKPVGNIWRGLITTVPLTVAAGAGFGLGVDALMAITEPYIGDQVKRLKAYFRSKQVSLLLSPQDDNLFPPHPKDYMETYEKGFRATLKQLGLWTMKTGISAITFSDKFGYTAARWAGGYDPFDKRVAPEDCKFTLTGQTIWDIFHEMSLRHPGWVYGVRPYGKEFRYTMFFGVPSQRYWARGADNFFIERANDLARLLQTSGEQPDIVKSEYRRLYGDQYGFGDHFLSLEELETEIVESAMFAAAAEGFRLSGNLQSGIFVREVAQNQGSYTAGVDPKAAKQAVDEDPDTVAGFVGADGAIRSQDIFNLDPTVLDTDTPIEESKFYKTIANQMYSTKAIKEYLLALSLRFEPFRRYHSFTSDHDLVWNGLVSSENAVYNAVDVTYFEEGATPGDSPVASELFKAHAFIPDHRLRVLPLQPSFNVKSYGMAMRYGQGALLHTMREMYRGEIIILGNARVRPWDIGIISDAYNDIVGPVEVEQVVHSFSHETGFITEIKPGACVFANEISSWPVLEAMKVMVLATKDVEDSYQGLRLGDAGSIARVLDWLLGKGAGANQEYLQSLQERADALRPFDPYRGPDGSDLPAINDLNEEIKDLIGLDSKVERNARLAMAGAGILTAGVAYKAAPILMKAFPRLGTEVASFVRPAAASATGLTVFGGGSALLGWAQSATPSLQWLLGGPVLFLSCLRGDSIMLVPLMKNGHPIVSGLSMTDPSMIWNNFKGDLARWASDYIDGTRDLTDAWRMYGTHAWRRLGGIERPEGHSYIDESNIAYAELTGESG